MVIPALVIGQSIYEILSVFELDINVIGHRHRVHIDACFIARCGDQGMTGLYLQQTGHTPP